MRAFALLSSVSLAVAGTVLFDGRFNDMTSSSELDAWSFSNPVGPYQYYIVSLYTNFQISLAHNVYSTVQILPLLTSTSIPLSRTLPTLAVLKESRSA